MQYCYSELCQTGSHTTLICAGVYVCLCACIQSITLLITLIQQIFKTATDRLCYLYDHLLLELQTRLTQNLSTSSISFG